jgi:long-chain acyl-CoA synthetase
LSVLAVLNAERWKTLAAAAGIPDDRADVTGQDAQKIVLARIGEQLKALPGHAQVRRAVLTLEPWTIENGLLTPTLKLKRAKVMEKFNSEIDRMYAGH